MNISSFIESVKKVFDEWELVDLSHMKGNVEAIVFVERCKRTQQERAYIINLYHKQEVDVDKAKLYIKRHPDV